MKRIILSHHIESVPSWHNMRPHLCHVSHSPEFEDLRFITGGKEAKQKIAMTTPVFMSDGGTNAAMAFVMPTKLKAGDVPKPAEEQLRLPPLALVLPRRRYNFLRRIFLNCAIMGGPAWSCRASTPVRARLAWSSSTTSMVCLPLTNC